MEDYIIVTDSTCDLPDNYYTEHNVNVMHLSCIMDGVTYGKYNKLNIQEFYSKLKNGSLPTTSQVNPDEAKTDLLEFSKKSNKILYLAFSSGLSGTYQSGVIAANELKETNPEITIEVVDSLAASLGEGLFVHKVVTMKENGASFEEVVDFAKNHRLNVGHVFTVDDLFHLYRGGRVSKATAVLGSMINIKPLLHVDNEGRLINIGKARGRKKSLISLVDMMEERVGSYRDKNDVIFISHSDCLEDAQFVADEIKKRFGYESFLINYIGPVIGAHTGQGTVALFFMADKR